jgi:hypothetical protein
MKNHGHEEKEGNHGHRRMPTSSAWQRLATIRVSRVENIAVSLLQPLAESPIGYASHRTKSM